MVLRKKCESIVNRANEEYGMRLVRITSFGRKRVALSNINLEFDGHDDCILKTSTKKHCYEDSFLLEGLPQDNLIRILCGVEHDDLKRLVFVSKAIRDVNKPTLITKQWHFAYITPRKTVGFQNVEDLGEFNDFEAPNAPKQSMVPRSQLSAKKLWPVGVRSSSPQGNM
ncbi:F-box protein SKIP27-like [Forsythia ovata]|uniref:F-box protein SKIP27-like n=1 Tax=Forsythia ovata TaxID=205694 RepID=A0ABD1U5E8_9LAMI